MMFVPRSVYTWLQMWLLFEGNKTLTISLKCSENGTWYLRYANSSLPEDNKGDLHT